MKKATLLLVGILMLTLSGCGNKLPYMPEDSIVTEDSSENAIVTKYLVTEEPIVTSEYQYVFRYISAETGLERYLYFTPSKIDTYGGNAGTTSELTCGNLKLRVEYNGTASVTLKGGLLIQTNNFSIESLIYPKEGL